LMAFTVFAEPVFDRFHVPTDFTLDKRYLAKVKNRT